MYSCGENVLQQQNIFETYLYDYRVSSKSTCADVAPICAHNVIIMHMCAYCSGAEYTFIHILYSQNGSSLKWDNMRRDLSMYQPPPVNTGWLIGGVWIGLVVFILCAAFVLYTEYMLAGVR